MNKPETQSGSSLDSLVLRWTPEQRDQAMGIVNDIAEDIDNGETREELRQALAIYADMLCDTLQNRAAQNSDALLDAMKKLITIMEQNAKVSSGDEPQ